MPKDRWLLDVGQRLCQPTFALPLLFGLFIAVRLIGLDATLTSDESYWVQRSLRFGAALARGDLNSTYRTGHPGVTVMWVGLLGIGPTRLEPFLGPAYVDVQAVERAPEYLEVLAVARRAIVVATAGLAVTIVGLAWKLFGPGPALVSGALLLLDPYLTGMTRLLHPDALLAPLMVVSMLAGVIFWTQAGGRRYLFLSAIATGLALLTKSPAVALIPTLGLVSLEACQARWRWRAWLTLTIVWGGLVSMTVIVCWPALWVNAIQRLGDVVDFVQSVGGKPHNWPTFFLGRRLSTDPGPLFYPVALAVRLSPIALAGLIGIGIVVWFQRGVSLAVGSVIGFVGLFVVMMTLGPKKLDRYILPAIMALDLLAGVGLWQLGGRLWQGHYRLTVLLIALGAQLALFNQASPYLLAAYNPLLGGIPGASRLVLVGWGEGLDQAAAYLNALPNAEQLVVTTHYHDVLRPLFRGTTVRMNSREPLDYCVVYVNMVQRDLLPKVVRAVMGKELPEFTVYVQGQPYAAVYHVPPDLQRQQADDPSEPEDFEDEHD